MLAIASVLSGGAFRYLLGIELGDQLLTLALTGGDDRAGCVRYDSPSRGGLLHLALCLVGLIAIVVPWAR